VPASQMFCRTIRALLPAAIFGSDDGMVFDSTSTSRGEIVRTTIPLSQPSNLGTVQSLVAHDPLPSTSSPSPALALPFFLRLALPFFLRLALKTDLRRLTLPLPLLPSCRGLVILPATALACRTKSTDARGSTLLLGPASEKEVCRFHLFPSRGIEQSQRHLSISLVQLRKSELMLVHISTSDEVAYTSPI
jgi:hypothetical protein